jgi:hypothetical protein
MLWQVKNENVDVLLFSSFNKTISCFACSLFFFKMCGEELEVRTKSQLTAM